MGLSEQAQAKMRVMQEKYLQALPEKLALIKGQYAVWCSDHNSESKKELKIHVHKLAGSAGMYGLDELSDVLKKIDQELATPKSNQAAILEGIHYLEHFKVEE